MFRIVSKENNRNNEDTNEIFYINETVDYKEILLENEKITINLPSVLKENSVIHKYSPFTFCDREINAIIKNETVYKIENLIQLKIVPVLIENPTQKQVIEEFKCMVIKPLYLYAKETTTTKKDGFLRSNHSNLLHSVTCMIATQQEGYLYQFCDTETQINTDNCIAIYPFTAPVYKLVMEDHLLHALTEVGLETYTLRIGHQLCRKLETIDNINSVRSYFAFV